MTTQQHDAELARKFALYEKRRLDRELRPRVPLPEQRAAAQHERRLRAAERRQRWIAWICAVALAAGIWWGVK